MPDWTAPFKLPKFTTAEFRKLRADYIAKYGYTYTYPGLFDVIKFGIETPLTLQEERDWKAKRFDQFSENRLYDIQQMKKKRKEKFLAMLSSPTPEFLTSGGALMTAIDNAQDAVYTLASAGIVAMRFSPPPIAALLALPTGALMTASAAMNLTSLLGPLKIPGKESKRAYQKKTGIDPYSKKGRIKYAKHLLKSFSPQAAVLQGLQTTQEIFGVGISLGPLVGFAIDAVATPIRMLFGQPVGVKLPFPSLDDLKATAHRYLRDVPIYPYFGLRTADSEVLTWMLATWISNLVLWSETDDRQDWANVPNIHQVDINPTPPTNPLTLEVIQEEGFDVQDVLNWPHNGKPWAPMQDIVNEYAAPAQDFFNDYMRLHDKDWIGYMFKTLACDSTFYTLACAEGEDQVEYDYTAASKAGAILLENHMYPDPGQPQAKIQLLADRIDLWESDSTKPTLRGMLDFSRQHDISLTSW